MNALTRASIASQAANEKSEILCHVRAPRSLRDTWIGDANDSSRMRAIEALRACSRGVTPAERLMLYPITYAA